MMVERGAAHDNSERTKVIVLSSSSNRDVRHGMPYPPFLVSIAFVLGSASMPEEGTERAYISGGAGAQWST